MGYLCDQLGSAEVVFVRRSDAFQALKRYNNVQLDGKPMRIEIIGTNSEVAVSARVNVVGGVNGRRTVVISLPCHFVVNINLAPFSPLGLPIVRDLILLEM
ncbi:hypothetical protein CsSME_00006232 [Camellia sinensis var. sinensis]